MSVDIGRPSWLTRPVVLATLGVAVLRLAVIPFLTHPGYTDAYYYFRAAERLAHGGGLTTDVVWNFIEAPGLAPLPIASLRFWMPLATAVQALGIGLFGPALGSLRAAELAIALVAIAIVPATYLLARRMGLSPRTAAVVGALAGIGGVEAVAWSSLDNFAPLAVLGALLFASLPGIARGARRDVVLGGLALGGIVLARADGPVYALAPLLLVRRAPRAVVATLALAALVAAPWYVRNALLGVPEGQLARAILLVRYEDFFRIAPPTLAQFLSSLDVVLTAKGAALRPDLLTFVLATGVVLGPIALVAAWRRRRAPIAAGWLAVTVVLFLAQWLLFTLHGTRGSLSHSLAGLVPAAVALALLEIEPFLPTARRFAAAFAIVAAVLLGALGVLQWKGAFDPAERAREAAVASGQVTGPVIAANAAAWAYALDGPALVTPADGIDALREVARRYGARTLVLEDDAYFSAYALLYRSFDSVGWLVPVKTDGPIHIWRIVDP